LFFSQLAIFFLFFEIIQFDFFLSTAAKEVFSWSIKVAVHLAKIHSVSYSILAFAAAVGVGN